jgi:hypothetical protein
MRTIKTALTITAILFAYSTSFAGSITLPCGKIAQTSVANDKGSFTMKDKLAAKSGSTNSSVTSEMGGAR